MKCRYYLHKHCSSCDLLSYDYLSSIKNKEQKLSHYFREHIANIKPSVICKNGTEGTRNKAKLAVALIHNTINFGFYNKAMQFTELEKCPLHAPAINNLLPTLKQLLSTHRVIPYDVFSKKGELKYVILTYSDSTNELLLRFIVKSTESLARLKALTQTLISLNPVVKVVTANIQPIHQAVLEGDDEIVLTEIDYITHHVDGYSLFQGPRSFFQTHSKMALQLYKQFQSELSTLNIHSLLDLYCGVGAFSFFASNNCTSVTGVEISDAAIFYANKAREINNSNNIHFLAMDAAAYLQNQASHSFDAILVNPPRRGLNHAIITDLMRLSPTYLFYSSCNVETLQKDLLQLETQYQIKSLQMFDMFPFTSHFETLAVLVKTIVET